MAVPAPSTGRLFGGGAPVSNLSGGRLPSDWMGSAVADQKVQDAANAIKAVHQANIDKLSSLQPGFQSQEGALNIAKNTAKNAGETVGNTLLQVPLNLLGTEKANAPDRPLSADEIARQTQYNKSAVARVALNAAQLALPLHGVNFWSRLGIGAVAGAGGDIAQQKLEDPSAPINYKQAAMAGAGNAIVGGIVPEIGAGIAKLSSLPEHGIPASEFKDVPTTHVTTPEELGKTVNDMQAKGVTPVASDHLPDGSLGVIVKDNATGDVALHKFTAPEPSLANDPRVADLRKSIRSQAEELAQKADPHYDMADRPSDTTGGQLYSKTIKDLSDKAGLHYDGRVKDPELLSKAIGHDVSLPKESGIQAAPSANTDLAAGGKATTTGSTIGEPGGEKGLSKLALRQGSKVEYDVIKKDARTKIGQDFAAANPEEARNILAGNAPERDGVTQQDLYRAAALGDNTELQRQAANEHTLGATEAGQRVSLYNVGEDNPVQKMGEVRADRVAKAGGEDKVATKVAAETTKIARTIKDTPLTTSDWQEFKDSLPAGPTSNKMLEAIRSGELDPQKLKDMTSAERNAEFAKYAGKEGAQKVNALFESKTLVKNQQKGMIAWAKQVAGLKPEVRRDIIASIERLDKVLTPADEKAFLADLAGQRLGVNVTASEAQGISDLTSNMNSLKESDPHSLDYGRSRVALDNYVADIKNNIKSPLSVGKVISDTAGLAKSLKATLDDSAIFRQGWKTMLTNPGIWAKNALGSFKDIIDTFGNKEVMDELHARTYADPNYDLMKKAKLAISTGEEEFPTALPEKVPLLGKVYKASEVAYTAFIQRQRVDIFNKYIDIARKTGVDLTSKEQLQGIGHLVNSLTGRGDLGAFEKSAGAVNNLFFSPRFLKANVDVLTSHVFDKGATAFARKQAAINLVKIIGGTAAILGVAHAANPDAVELDPRSSDFGKIKVGDTRFDVAGGMGSLATLAARILTSSSKSSKTGAVTQNNTGKFGSQTTGDVIKNFTEGKLSPLLSTILQVAQKQDSNGNPITVGGEASNLLMPLPVANYLELKKDPNSAPALAAMIADGLGISTNTYDQGQSQAGDKGTQAKAVAALVAGDDKGARDIISSLPADKQAAALDQAATSAAAHTKHQSSQTVDFYSAYHTANSERTKASAQVTQLVKDGKTSEAARIAHQYNSTIPGQFTSYSQKYGSLQGDPAKMVKSLEIHTDASAMKARSKVTKPLSFQP